MYPNIYYVLKDWFGVDWQIFKIAATFGVFVAIAFIVAAWVLTIELKRKQKQGLLTYTEKEITIGEPASIPDLITNFLIGFLFGYKILSILFLKNGIADPQDYIFSSNGNLWTGLALGIVAAALRWFEANKTKLAKPEKRIIRLWPHDRVGDLIMYAFIFGFLGAKVFHNLENWNEFTANPIDALFSASGLTFYGGLICAAIAIYFYTKKYNIAYIKLADAMAPALMIAYAIGRVGCQLSGDGDWGIINSAFINEAKGFATPSVQEFNEFIINNHQYYFRGDIKSVEQIHHLSIQPVSWLPHWMFGYTYPNNVLSEGVKMMNCSWGDHCYALPLAVFPTPFYETIISTIFFIILMSVRNKIKTTGVMFGIYLMMNGFERFWIEKIRVNTQINFLGFHPTQAEIISTSLFLVGLGLVGYLLLNKKQTIKEV
jgi:phosphatidylglycerol---prolipoprotein diacylglyceryl transferase